MHPDFKNGKPYCIDKKEDVAYAFNQLGIVNGKEKVKSGEVSLTANKNRTRAITFKDTRKDRECIFYFKENINYMNSLKKKWKYLDTSR